MRRPRLTGTLRNTNMVSLLVGAVFVVGFGSVGVRLLIASRAALPVVSFEAEDTTFTDATLVDNPAASGGKQLKFGAVTR